MAANFPRSCIGCSNITESNGVFGCKIRSHFVSNCSKFDGERKEPKKDFGFNLKSISK